MKLERMRAAAPIVRDGLAIGGVGLSLHGIGEIYAPLQTILAGLVLVGIAIIWARRA